MFACMVLVARDENALQDTAAKVRLQKTDVNVIVMPIDLREKRAPHQVVRRCIQHFGKVHAVVNIAGAVPQVNLLETTDEQWEDGFSLKLHSARRLTVAAWPALKQSGGSVIFISGNSAELPKAAFGAVSTVNAAIIALSKAFADQGYDDSIQVNCVLPGPVMTSRRLSYLKKWSDDHNMSLEEAKTVFPREARIARYGEAAEVASLIYYILSPDAKWMTGSSIRFDGGEIKTI